MGLGCTGRLDFLTSISSRGALSSPVDSSNVATFPGKKKEKKKRRQELVLNEFESLTIT